MFPSFLVRRPRLPHSGQRQPHHGAASSGKSFHRHHVSRADENSGENSDPYQIIHNSRIFFGIRLGSRLPENGTIQTSSSQQQLPQLSLPPNVNGRQRGTLTIRLHCKSFPVEELWWWWSQRGEVVLWWELGKVDCWGAGCSSRFRGVVPEEFAGGRITEIRHPFSGFGESFRGKRFGSSWCLGCGLTANYSRSVWGHLAV